VIRRDFGRYKIAEELGRGTMGVVYRATDPVLGRVVAIKAINDTYVQSAGAQAKEYYARFQREAEVAGRLNHPHIVKIFDLGPDYIVMEFVEGQSLDSALRAKARFSLSHILDMVSQVADALDHAHREGVVHRDIKPANIMLRPDGSVTVMDFGLARIESSTLTAAGEILGSASYMAPEAVRGAKADARSDIFGLGVVAYELMTGDRPFPGPSITAILYRIVQEAPVRAHSLNLNVPPSYDDIFNRVLAKDPAQRYATAGEFASALVFKKWADRDPVLTERYTEGPGGTTDPTLAGPRAGTTPLPVEAPPEPEAPTEIGSPLEMEAPPTDTTQTAVDAVNPATAQTLREPLPTLRMVAAAPPDQPTVLMARPAEGPGHAPVAPGLPPTVPETEGVRPSRLPLLLGAAGILVVGAALAAVLVLRARLSSAPPSTASPGVAEVIPSASASAPDSSPSSEAAAPPAEPSTAAATPAPEASPAPAAAPSPETTATLSVTSSPPGATVRVGSRKQVAPYRFDLPAGTVGVTVEKEGFKTWHRQVTLRAGRSTQVRAQLEPLSAAPAPPSAPRAGAGAVREGALVPLGPDVTPPRKIAGDSPGYPEMARRQRRGGSVVLEWVVGIDGAVADLKVVESAGELFDGPVADAVRRWRYEPATRDGVKVRVVQRQKFTFQTGR
jgi:TonB family protein